jgi:hypothetical protein
MSVARRELKTVEDLRAWIEVHAGGAGISDEGGAPLYVIVRQPPTCGGADWNVVVRGSEGGGGPRWSPARQHAIRTARLMFDVR